ncbi:MAG: polyribonucleotide nucleotidyltransferase [Candidatus Aminicenantes bacterium]|nr:polyribonucleotide nucleotidyltransferase [Candidatus Aminicenantes bacterium]
MSHTISLEINHRTLSIELGKMGKQADGSAFVRYGETVVFVAVTSKKEAREDRPFLPLVVDYRESTYAAGKIPGGFFKREGRPTEREILVSRLIDRPVRSLFPDGYHNDTQIVALLFSADLENEPDTLGLIGASAALYLSDIPFTTPFGAVKVGLADGKYIINPTGKELESSPLNLLVVGTEDGVSMIEAGAKEVDEETMMGAIEAAVEPIRLIIKAQKDLYDKLGVTKRKFEPKLLNEAKLAEIEAKIGSALHQAIQTPGKKAHDAAVDAVQKDLLAGIPEENEDERNEAKALFEKIYEQFARRMILDEGHRVDGRNFDDIRPISIEVGLLPRTHGSALFTRGETQSLAIITLGTVQDAQRLDGLGEEVQKRFMLHYNFPPFSVGEAGFLRGPGRREIGHGALAEKSILPAIPAEEQFPYTVRIVSEILESNGSSSMATVCSGVLALMDAGAPLNFVPAGIAMGLVKEGDRHVVLTDIAGIEDHFGDMDFKVAGSEKGITAIQVDLKLDSIPLSICREALAKAKTARLKVLAKMKEALPQPRTEISPYAPRILFLYINPEKVGEVIGPAGKIIKKIVSTTKAKIDIDETGKVVIASADMEAAERAKQMILDLTAEAEVGQTYTGKVVRIEEYGAFVEIMPNLVGLMHVSEIAPYHVRSVSDVLHLGDVVTVKVLTIEDNRIRLSMKALNPDAAPPEGYESQGGSGNPNPHPPRSDRDRGRGGRGGGRGRY